MESSSSTSAGLYERLIAQRDPYLRRARDCAKLTIPHLLTEQGHGPSTKLYTPYQSIGARGVASLSSKLLLALFPPSSPFFKLTVDPFELQKVSEDQEIRTEIETTLNRIEQAVMAELESKNMRPYLHEAIKQLIIAGNVLVHMPTKGPIKVFKMDRYCVKRDAGGDIQNIILKECIAPTNLPDYLQERASQDIGSMYEDTCDIYTCIHRVDDSTFEVHQEAFGERIEQTAGKYKEDKLPWLALRMEPVTGESYGYGYAASLLGDLKSLEGLTMNLVESAAAASKTLFLVDPASPTRAKTLAEAPNGAIREGRATDVTVVNMGSKAADIRGVMETANSIKERLGHAFLLNTSIQRKGERVTAEEIRYMAQELENVLAGTYSLLSAEFQLPLVRIMMSRMTKEKRLPSVPKKIVHPTIVTGLEALGRGSDLTKLDLFIQGAMATFGPELMSRNINVRDYLARRAVSLGLVTDGLIRSEEEIAAEQQAMQQQQMLQSLGPQVVQALSKGGTPPMDPDADPTAQLG